METEAVAMIVKLANYGVGFKKTSLLADQYDPGKKSATDKIQALGNGPVGQFLNGDKNASITIPHSHIKEDMKNEKKVIHAAGEMLIDDKKALEKKGFIAPLVEAIAVKALPTIANIGSSLLASKINPTRTIQQGASNLVKSVVS